VKWHDTTVASLIADLHPHRCKHFAGVEIEREVTTLGNHCLKALLVERKLALCILFLKLLIMQILRSKRGDNLRLHVVLLHQSVAWKPCLLVSHTCASLQICAYLLHTYDEHCQKEHMVYRMHLDDLINQ